MLQHFDGVVDPQRCSGCGAREAVWPATSEGERTMPPNLPGVRKAIYVVPCVGGELGLRRVDDPSEDTGVTSP